MRRVIFILLSKINKLVLPRYSQRDITKLSTLDKLIVAYRYWVTKNTLR